MAIWELLTEYVCDTVPVASISLIFVMGQIIFQATQSILVILSSAQRRSGAERLFVGLVPLVFVVTYAVMDALLGGSFLGGGFHDTKNLFYFLHDPRLFWEVGALLVLFVPLNLLVSRWLEHIKWWVMLITSLASWGVYLVCLVGFVGIFTPLERVFMSERLVLWYTYSIYAILFQVLLSLTAVSLRLLFSEREEHLNSEENLYDDRWCKKQITRLLLRGHRIFLLGMGSLVLLLCILIYPEAREEPSPVLIGFPVIFILVLLVVALRALFPSMVRSVRRVWAWEDGERRRRMFCEEFFDPHHSLYHGDGIDLSEHFVLMRSTLYPILLYLNDIELVQFNGRQYAAVLKNGERVPLLLINEKDVFELRRRLVRSPR